MSNETETTGGTSTTEASSQVETQSQQPTEDLVPKRELSKVLDDMHRYKAEARDLKAKINAVEEQNLKEKQDWKALAEKREQERSENEQKLKQQQEYILHTERHREVLQHASRAGIIDAKDLDRVDLSELKVDLNTAGRFEVHGAKEYVERLQKDKPHWFRVDTPPNVNSGGGGAAPSTDGQLKPEDVAKAKTAAMRGEITQGQYLEIQKKYLAQVAPKSAS